MSTPRRKGFRSGPARTPYLILAALLALLLLATPAAGACRNENTPPSGLTVKSARSSMTCLINEVRRKAGVRKLRTNRRLTRAAQRFSWQMDAQNFFSHVSPGGSSPATRIKRAGYMAGTGTWGIAENLRFGSGHLGTPKNAVRAWLNSSSHRASMLSRRYREVGVGVAIGSPIPGQGRDAAIYTADFGYRG